MERVTVEFIRPGRRPKTFAADDFSVTQTPAGQTLTLTQDGRVVATYGSGEWAGAYDDDEMTAVEAGTAEVGVRCDLSPDSTPASTAAGIIAQVLEGCGLYGADAHTHVSHDEDEPAIWRVLLHGQVPLMVVVATPDDIPDLPKPAAAKTES